MDPLWDDPTQKLEGLSRFLLKVHEMFGKFGKLKKKRLEEILKSITDVDLVGISYIFAQMFRMKRFFSGNFHLYFIFIVEI